MWVKFRHSLVFAVLRPVFKLFLFFKYGYTFAKFKCGIKRPYLILSNHVTTLDPFMVALSFNSPVYYVASDDLFSLKLSPLIRYLVAPIPKTKSSSDINTVKDCYKVIKQGGNICVFPEGNRTYSGVTLRIPFSIVKLVRLLKAPLLLFRIEGGYGVEPRWAGNIRRGKMYGGVYRVLSFEDYKVMSDDALYKYITDSLYVNAFDDALQSGSVYKSAELAKYIERFLYACPGCGSFSSLRGIGEDIVCEKCGLTVNYGKDLRLKVKSGGCPFTDLKEWDVFQKEKIKNFDLNSADKEPVFSDKGVFLRQNIRAKRKIGLCAGTLKLYNDRLSVTGGKTFTFNMQDICSMAVFGKNKLCFYTDNSIYHIIGNKRFNALKYVNMFYHIKNKIEGVTDEFLGL